MPIEIRELVIRAVSTAPSDGSESAPPEQSASDQREEIVQECVRQVMRILKKNKER